MLFRNEGNFGFVDQRSILSQQTGKLFLMLPIAELVKDFVKAMVSC